MVIARQCYDQGKTFAEMMDDYKKYSGWYVELILESRCADGGYDPLDWFRGTFGKQYEYGKFLDHSSPRPGANTNNVSRRIANSIAAKRNPALIKNLCDISTRHRVVAYVIGRDHIWYDLPVLMEMFGEYTIVG